MMNIIAVDDEKLALELLVDSIEKVVPEAKVNGFRKTAEALSYVHRRKVLLLRGAL